MIPIAIVLWTVLAGALALIYYVRCVEPRRIEATRVEVPLETLPEALEGLTIAHLSDFHCRPTAASRQVCREAISLANAAAPDLVVITGDLADGYDVFGQCVEQFEGLSAPLGVWAVLGNHDHYRLRLGAWWRDQPPTDEQRSAALGSVGIELLLNEARRLEIRGSVVALVGVGDVSMGRDDLPAALAGAAGADLVIVISHSPDILDAPGVEAADLVLCGHTHGGQVTLPGIGSPWAPVWCDRRRAAGLMRAAGQLCYVNRGVASATPARFLCPPEVALLVLRRGSPEDVRQVPVHRRAASAVEGPAPTEEVIS